MGLDLSLTHWPVVVATFTPGQLREDIPAYLDHLDRILQKNTSYVVLTDASRVVGVPDAKTRQLTATWIQDRRAKLVRLNKGDAIYVPSSLLRGALTAIDWLTTPPCPRHYPLSVASGLVWCRKQLGAGAVETAG
jgi:hypothetical protein